MSEIATFRRSRSSTNLSAGLDYRTCLRIFHEEINQFGTLVSQHTYPPPDEAWCDLEEIQGSIHSSSKEDFDFSTAKSVAKLVRAETGRLSLPSRVEDPLSMEVDETMRSFESTRRLQGRSTVCSTSSSIDLSINTRLLGPVDLPSLGFIVDGATVHDTLLSDCPPPCEPDKHPKSFGFPRLVLQDKSPDTPQYSPLENLFGNSKSNSPKSSPKTETRPRSLSLHLDSESSPSVGSFGKGDNSNIPDSSERSSSTDWGSKGGQPLEKNVREAGFREHGGRERRSTLPGMSHVLPKPLELPNSQPGVGILPKQPETTRRKPWLPEFAKPSSTTKRRFGEIEQVLEQGVEMGIEKGLLRHHFPEDMIKLAYARDLETKNALERKVKGHLHQSYVEFFHLHIPQEIIDSIQHRAVHNINITPEQRDVILQHIPPKPGASFAPITLRHPSMTQEHAEYWGFVPAVNDAVQHAVQVAVHKAVHKVILPPGVKKDDASGAYRRLVASSLTEAAQRADDYLRKTSAFSVPQSPKNESADLNRKKQLVSAEQSSSRKSTLQNPISASQPVPISENTANLPRGSSSAKEVINTVQKALAGGMYTPSQYSGTGNSGASTTGPSSPPRYTAPESPSYEQLVENEEQFPQNANEKQKANAKKLPGRWKSLGKNIRGYDLIPEREASPEVSRKASLEQIIIQAGQNLRSASSMTSLGAKSSKDHHVKFRNSGHSHRGKTLSPLRAPKLLPGNPDNKRTVHWLRGILVDDGPHSARFTALPQHNRPITDPEPKTTRSQSTPYPVEQLFLDPPPNSEPQKPNRPSRNSSGARISEAFTRTIDDLENLLNEALHIARVAAKEESEHIPALLEDAATLLHRGRIGPIARLTLPKDDERLRPTEEDASLQSVHESARSDFSGSLDSVSYTASEDEGSVEDGPFGTKYVESKRLAGYQSRSLISPPRATVLLDPTETSGLIVEVADKTILKSKANCPETRKKDLDTAFLSRPTSGRSSEPFTRPGAQQELAGINEDSALPPKDGKPRQGRKSRVSQPDNFPNKREVDDFIRTFNQPPIAPRGSSLTKSSLVRRRANTVGLQEHNQSVQFAPAIIDDGQFTIRTLSSFQSDGPIHSDGSEMVHFGTPNAYRHNTAGITTGAGAEGGFELTETLAQNQRYPSNSMPRQHMSGKTHRVLDLRGKPHVSLQGKHHHGFSMSRTHKRQPIARDWSTGRKRWVASVACLSTAMIGIVAGIYAGEVPSVQYYIADLDHYAVLGNVVFFIGLSIPVFFLWPLPLLHGRKPYIMGSMTVAMPLLFPQALVTGVQRSPYEVIWRFGLLFPRAIMGLALGLAQMNFINTLLDLFGASLQSANPHQEVVDEFDVRRHGGGMGIWLGLWTWCYCASIGLGFHIGAWIIDTMSPDWGFYVAIIIVAVVLLLNVVTPEVRRSAYRKSVAEIRTATEVTRRLAKGEVKMHRVQSGPKWFGEEVYHGILLSSEMLRQPGFLIMVLYVAWVYAQIVLVVVLLGSLTSKVYSLKSPVVGATTLSIPVGAILSTPFQKAGLFSRDRRHSTESDMQTFQKQIHWSSHLVRRTIFTILLPTATLAYTLSSGGPPIPVELPVTFACAIGFLSNLAIAECNGIIMETFDTSDLQPGMTGRPRGASGERSKHKRTNYSSFPRIASAFALIQGFGFLIAAAATGVGGVAQRNLGQQASTSVMGGILFVLTILLLLALSRFQEVQIIPDAQAAEMEQWETQRRQSIKRLEERKKTNSWNSQRGISNEGQGGNAPEEEEEPWRPIIIGNPTGKTRRMSLLEMGGLTRWSEIRRRNKLIDEGGLEAYHPNRAALHLAKQEIKRHGSGSLRRMRRHKRRAGELVRGDSGRSVLSEDSGNGDLGERSPLSASFGRKICVGLEWFWRAMGMRGGVQEVEIHGGGFPDGWAWKSKHSVGLCVIPIVPVVRIIEPPLSEKGGEQRHKRVTFEDAGFEVQRLM